MRNSFSTTPLIFSGVFIVACTYINKDKVTNAGTVEAGSL